MKGTLIALQIAQFLMVLTVTTGSFLIQYMIPIQERQDIQSFASDVGTFKLPMNTVPFASQMEPGTGLMPVSCLKTTTEAFASFLGAIYVMALLLFV
jgi:hypothetical protein